MKKLALSVVLVLAALAAIPAHAQVYFANTRVGALLHSRASVGTTAAAATSSVGAGILAWKICADAANSNYVAVGLAADPDTDGVRLVAGQCFECPNCAPGTLKAAKVKGGAASQGYSIVQYKGQ